MHRRTFCYMESANNSYRSYRNIHGYAFAIALSVNIRKCLVFGNPSYLICMYLFGKLLFHPFIHHNMHALFGKIMHIFICHHYSMNINTFWHKCSSIHQYHHMHIFIRHIHSSIHHMHVFICSIHPCAFIFLSFFLSTHECTSK